MGRALEIATAYISLAVSTEGIGKQIAAGLASGDKMAADAGRRYGEAISRGVSSTKVNLSGVTAEVEKTKRAVETASKEMEAARHREAQAASLVKQRTQELEAAVQKYGAESAQAIAKDRQLSDAKYKLSTESQKALAATTSLKQAQEKAKTAAKEFASAQDQAGRSTDGFRQKLANAFKNPFSALVSDAKRSGTEMGNKLVEGARTPFTSGIKSLLGSVGGIAAAAGVGLSAGALIGQTFTGGLDRYLNIQNAQAKLKALGNSTDDVNRIMDGALASVKGTAFGLGDATNIAAQAVAAGIKPGDELNKTLQTIANTSAVAGTSMQDTGMVFMQIAAKGKADSGDLQQLADRGIPAMTLLAKSIGKPREEVAKMVSDGKVDFKTFQDAMAKGMSPEAAKTMGDTLQGSMDNAKAAMSRFGASVIEQVGPSLQDALKKVPDLLDNLTKKIPEVIAKFQEFGGWVQQNKSWLEPLAVAVSAVAAGFVAYQLAMTAIQLPIRIATAAQVLWNAAMAANPVGLVIAALIALTVALVYAWNHSETFRNVVMGAWNGIKAAADAVVKWFTGTALPAFQAVWNGIVAGAKWLGGLIATVWNGIVAGVQAVVGFVMPIFQALWSGIVAGFEFLKTALFVVTVVIVGSLVAIFTFLANAVMTVVRPIWELISAGFQWLAGVLTAVVTAIVDWVVSRFTWWRDVLTAIVTAIWNGVTAIWDRLSAAIRAIVQPLVDWGAQKFVEWRDKLTFIVSVLRDWIVEKWTALKNGVMGVIQPLIDWATDRFNRWRDALVAVATTIKDWVVQRFEDLSAGASRVFEAMVGGIGKIWDGLKAVAAKPVRFVVDTIINNGILKGWNDLVGMLKLPENLRVQPINVPGFETGGILPGPGTSRGDDMLVIDRHGRPAATVASGEPIISRQQYAANRPIVDSILAGERLPGFFLGGFMPTPGPVRPHRLPYYGATWAGDMGLGMGSPIYAWKDGVVGNTSYKNTSYGNETNINHAGQSTKYAHQSAILVKPGDVVKAGQLIGRIGSTGNSTGPHLHFEVRGGNVAMGDASGSSDGGGVFDMAAQWVTDKLSAPVRALIDRIPGAGVFVDAAKGMGTRLMDAAVEKIKSIIPSFGDSGASVPGIPMQPGGPIPTVMEMVRKMGLPRKVALIAGITMAQEASGQLDFTPDENSDVGPFQQRTPRDGTIQQLNDLSYALRVFLYGTRARPGNGDGGGYHVPGLFDKKWQGMDPGAAAQAVQVSAFPSYYNKHIPRINALLDSMGFYDAGGWLKPGNTLAMNKTGKPEAVLTAEQWASVRDLVDMQDRRFRAHGASGDKQGNTYNVTFAAAPDVNIDRQMERFVWEVAHA